VKFEKNDCAGGNQMTMRREKISAIDALQGLGRISDLVKKDYEFTSANNTAVNLPIEKMVPDPHQARRVLPDGIRERFFRGEIDPATALKEWKQIAEKDKIEASMLDGQILRLARSLQAQEQIYPITISQIPDDSLDRYLIETGERRWWSHWWLFGVENDDRFETIQAIVVEKPSPWRQAAENLQGEPLTAVQEACQVARLLLLESGVEPEYELMDIEQSDRPGLGSYTNIQQGYDFFRQAATQRAPQGAWSRIEQATGKGRRYCQYLLGLFNLCDRALAEAERARLTESQLRPLASGEKNPERQIKIVRLIVERDLGRAEVESLVNEPNLDDAIEKIDKGSRRKKTQTIRAPEEIVVERLLSMTRLLDRASRSETSVVGIVTREMIQAGEIETRRHELASLRSFLGELISELDKAVLNSSYTKDD